MPKKKKPTSTEEQNKQFEKQFDWLTSQFDREALKDYAMYLKNPWRIWWHNFTAGLARGFGFMLGATVLVTIFVWILVKILPALPWVGDFFTWLNEEIDWESLSGLVRSISTLVTLTEQQNQILTEILNKLP